MFWENYDYLCRKAGTSANAVAALCGVRSTGTVTNWKNGAMPNAKTLAAIADYFGISIEDLTGEFIPVKEKSPAGESAGDKELKFALFGGEKGITDEMLDEVRQFAQMVKLREEQKRKG